MTLEPKIVDDNGQPVMSMEHMMLVMTLEQIKTRMLRPDSSFDACPRMNQDWSHSWKPSKDQALCCEEGCKRYQKYLTKVAEDTTRRRVSRS